MVAEDGEDAVRRRSGASSSGDRADDVAIAARHVVAAEHDQIWLRRTGQVHRARDIVGCAPAAVMDVGEQRDAQAVERRRQSGDRQRRFGDAEAMAFVGDAVARRRRSARRSPAAERRP